MTKLSKPLDTDIFISKQTAVQFSWQLFVEC